VAIYADNQYVKDTLGWEIKYSLDEMMLTAWKWEQRLKEEEHLYSVQNAGLN